MKYTQHKPYLVRSSVRALPMTARGKTTSARLAKPVYSRLVPPAGRFPGGDMTAFFRFLSERVQALDDKAVAESLQDFLPPDELPGLSMRFRAEMAKLL